MALHVYPAAEAVLLPALVVDVALAVWAWNARRDAAKAGASAAGGLVWALAAALTLGAASWLFYGEWARVWPVGGGLLLGLVLGLLWESPGAEADERALGPLAAGLAALALGALVAADAVAFANWGIALVLGWGAYRLVPLWAGPEETAEARDGAGTAFALVALAAGAAAWGEKLAPGQHLGAPLTLGLASTLALAFAVGRLLDRRGGTELGSRFAGAGVFALGAAAWMTIYAQPWPLLAAVWAGGALGLALGAIALPTGLASLAMPPAATATPEPASPGVVDPAAHVVADASPEPAPAAAAQPTASAAGASESARAIARASAPASETRSGGPWGGVVWGVLIGALLVVDNRLGGIVAVGLGGLGLGLGAVGGRLGALRPLLAGALAIFAARVYLQLFLDRTALTTYGVDLTHPYATAGLVLGALALVGAWAIARLVRDDAWLLGGWTLAVASAPVWFGYFLHVEPLGAWIAGAIAALFVLLVPQPRPLASRATAATLTLTLTAACLWAAPFLVPVMNASRASRLMALGALAALALAGVARYAWRFGRRAPRPE